MKRVTRFLFILSLFVILLGIPVIAAHASPLIPQETAPALDFDNLITTLKSLTGIAMLIAAVVNVMKATGVAQDKQAGAWSAVFNLIALFGLLIAQITGYTEQIPSLDGQAGMLATVVEVVFAFAWQLLASRKTHDIILAGIPLFGKSFSNKVAGESNLMSLSVGG
jgi:hypothetical protein